jgi:hypothetical protein
MTTAGQAIERGEIPSQGVSLSRKVLGALGCFLSRCRSFARSQLIAEGYEDEHGFHYGKKPHPNCINLNQYSREAGLRNNFETTRTAVANAETRKPASASVTGDYSFASARKK